MGWDAIREITGHGRRGKPGAQGLAFPTRGSQMNMHKSILDRDDVQGEVDSFHRDEFVAFHNWEERYKEPFASQSGLVVHLISGKAILRFAIGTIPFCLVEASHPFALASVPPRSPLRKRICIGVT